MPKPNPYEFGGGQYFPSRECIGTEELGVYLNDLHKDGILQTEELAEISIKSAVEGVDSGFKMASNLAIAIDLTMMKALDDAEQVMESLTFEGQTQSESRVSRLLRALGSSTIFGLAISSGYGVAWFRSRKKPN